MQQDSDFQGRVSFLCGDGQVVALSGRIPVLPACSELVLSFFDALSHTLMSSREARAYPDVVTWAFWIRRASLEKAARRISKDARIRVGRGFALHIAPSNVPVNFAVSMTSSLLAGNITAVRVPSREFEQVRIICDAINSVLGSGFEAMRPYLAVMRYGHDDAINASLSSMCDLRVVWGGDATVAAFRAIAIPPRAIEMDFPDRHSLCVVDSSEYLKMDPSQVALLFYTDTYYSDQNACSSPRAVIWLGSGREEARERFYKALHDLVFKRYAMQPIQAVDKLNAFCELAAAGFRPLRAGSDNLLWRIEGCRADARLMDFKQPGGYFFDIDASSLEDALPLMDKRCQTVSCIGVDPAEVARMAAAHGARGVDRVVAVGHTMDLSFTWDGFDMIESMSRIIDA